MKPSGKPGTLSSIILALAGTTLVGAGLYFVTLAARNKLLAVYIDRSFVTSGGLISYGPSD